MARRAADPRRRGQWAVLAVAVALFLVWGSPALWPLAIAVVFAHECSHALAALATGGRVVAMELGWNEGGATWTEGGWPLLTLNAGYLGSLAFGLGLLRLVRWARGACVALGALSAGIAVLWMPWLSFGCAFTVVWGLGLAWVATRTPDWVSAAILRIYGVFSVLYALGDIRADVFGAPAGAVSDATMLAAATGVPAAFWGGAWLAVGAAAVWWGRGRWGG